MASTQVQPPRVLTPSDDVRRDVALRLLEPYPHSVEDFTLRKFPLPLTTGASAFVQLDLRDPGVPKVLCFSSYHDVKARFTIVMGGGVEMVNNITETGPCIYIMSPTSGDFEFQLQRNSSGLHRWLRLFQEIGVKFMSFDEIYKFTKVVGEGSFGKVSMGHHRPSGGVVCLKSIQKTNQKIFSVYHEIGIMRRISHPNVVQLYASYEDDAHVHMVMEYCPEGEVFDYLQKHGNYEERQARHVARRLLQALEYLHGIGIVHRDLKTENLLLTHPEDPTRVKLIDFGLSAIMQNGVNLKMRCGSPGFVAPEILNGDVRGYGTMSDVFGAGAVLYTLISGLCPFKGNDPKEIMRKNSRCVFSFAHPAWSGVSDSCKDLICWCMEKSPSNRCTATQALEHPWIRGEPCSNVAHFHQHKATTSSGQHVPGVSPLQAPVMRRSAGVMKTSKRIIITQYRTEADRPRIHQPMIQTALPNVRRIPLQTRYEAAPPLSGFHHRAPVYRTPIGSPTGTPATSPDSAGGYKREDISRVVVAGGGERAAPSQPPGTYYRRASVGTPFTEDPKAVDTTMHVSQRSTAAPTPATSSGTMGSSSPVCREREVAETTPTSAEEPDPEESGESFVTPPSRRSSCPAVPLTQLEILPLVEKTQAVKLPENKESPDVELWKDVTRRAAEELAGPMNPPTERSPDQAFLTPALRRAFESLWASMDRRAPQVEDELAASIHRPDPTKPARPAGHWRRGGILSMVTPKRNECDRSVEGDSPSGTPDERHSQQERAKPAAPTPPSARSGGGSSARRYFIHLNPMRRQSAPNKAGAPTPLPAQRSPFGFEGEKREAPTNRFRRRSVGSPLTATGSHTAPAQRRSSFSNLKPSVLVGNLFGSRKGAS